MIVRYLYLACIVYGMEAKEFFTEEEISDMAEISEWALSDQIGYHLDGENQDEEPLYHKAKRYNRRSE